MKRFLFVTACLSCVAACVISARTGGCDYEQINAQGEVLTGSEACLIIPGQKQGKCREDADGGGYSCVKSYWFEFNDCTSD